MPENEQVTLVPTGERGNTRVFVFGAPKLIARWVIERTPGLDSLENSACFGLAAGGNLIMGMAYNKFSGHDICLNVAAEPNKRWATRPVLRAIFAYPFLQLGVRRVTALVATGNTASRSLVESLGWTREGLMRDALPGDDLIVYGMTRAECRWLETSHE